MGNKSIMQTGERACYLCSRVTGLERHHVLAGPANRRISEAYGLWVWLCHDCHTGRYGAQYDGEKGLQLKRDAQMAFQKYYGRKLWMQLFRKNYLDEEWRANDDERNDDE